MEVGVHLPQIDVLDGHLSSQRIVETVAAARACGAIALSANDHFAFPVPWLDGLVALSAAAQSSGPLDLMTSVTLPALRGPMPVASALAALSCLSGGRVIAGVGPGSSALDYSLVGQPFEERWSRFDAAIVRLRELLGASEPTDPSPPPAALAVARSTIPVWVASWDSPAGLRRVARLGDGWLASAYHQTPEGFGQALDRLMELCSDRGRPTPPHAVGTMWLWITESSSDAERVLAALAHALGRDVDELRLRVCIGSAEHCIDLLVGYAAVGCQRMHFWPVADEPRQLSLLAERVLSLVKAGAASSKPALG
jgi:alkanesulfonate monooxygenase SsuD/methylene tetrahydromethanopterin reductase-like flavin-dependent oxidoreductase (luciferase family)